MRIGIYPGTFDPITNGHLDIIKRGRQLFDKLYVVIPINPNKKTFFTLDERIDLLKEVLKDFNNVEVTSTDQLTVDFARKVGATVMLRGLRMVSDFEYELQLATLNRTLKPDLETIFIMASHEFSFLSSGSVKEIAAFGGSFEQFVPLPVAVALKKKYKLD
ncbi:MAG: pantetheine-phosphate adenylyltransferase [Bacilli bacterium]|jgi:pantetheine-phosphate adenylyltransferase|nr:pantetheine-phosphate adenylyltransferase [Acholeplasmataceae bacterium]